MDDEDDTVMTIPARPFAMLDVAIVALDTAASFLYDMKMLLCGHANYRVQRRIVADQMRESIERIVGE